MSDIRKERQELKQGLHQFLMDLYMKTKQTAGRDVALQLMHESIQDEFHFFFSNEQEYLSKQDVEAYIAYLKEEASQEDDPDLIQYYKDKASEAINVYKGIQERKIADGSK